MVGENDWFPRTPSRGPFLPTPAPGVVEMLANGSFEDKILPANEMRRSIRLPVGLGEPDTSGCPGCVCLRVGICKTCLEPALDRKEGFAKAVEEKMLTRKSDLYISMLKYYADRKKDATDLCSPVR